MIQDTRPSPRLAQIREAVERHREELVLVLAVRPNVSSDEREHAAAKTQCRRARSQQTLDMLTSGQVPIDRRSILLDHMLEPLTFGDLVTRDEMP